MLLFFLHKTAPKVKGGLLQFYASVGENRYGSPALEKCKTPLPATPPRKGAWLFYFEKLGAVLPAGSSASLMVKRFKPL